MAEQLIKKVDETIDYVNKAGGAEEKKEEVELLSAKGYKDQTFAKLVTKIDDKRTNEGQIPLLGLGVCSNPSHHYYCFHIQIQIHLRIFLYALTISLYIDMVI